MASPDTHAKMFDAFQRVSLELNKESERGCVVLAFAWMDDEITRNLQRFLLPSSRTSLKSDELFGVGQSLGTSAAKIDLSLRLGLLHVNTHQSLHLFRKLRNDFAHLSSNLTFETPNIRDRVLAIFDNEEMLLNGLWEAVVADPQTRKVTEEHRSKSGARILRDAIPTRQLFAMTASALVSALILIGDTLQPLAPPTRAAGEA
jgi:hypothetical protein